MSALACPRPPPHASREDFVRKHVEARHKRYCFLNFTTWPCFVARDAGQKWDTGGLVHTWYECGRAFTGVVRGDGKVLGAVRPAGARSITRHGFLNAVTFDGYDFRRRE